MIDSLSAVPMLAPVNCTNGCALWSDLAKDGNKHNQSEVDAKWLKGSAPAEAQSRCAMPSKDPGTDTYWCYCKDPNPTLLDWGYCQSPTKPVPEQINLQVPEFVTFFLKGGRFLTSDSRGGPVRVDDFEKGRMDCFALRLRFRRVLRVIFMAVREASAFLSSESAAAHTVFVRLLSSQSIQKGSKVR